MQPITRVNEYLGLADIDYLAARILILNGLPSVGLAKSAEAFEKQFKLFFLIYLTFRTWGNKILGLYHLSSTRLIQAK